MTPSDFLQCLESVLQHRRIAFSRAAAIAFVDPAPTLEEIATVVTRVLRRNEESRIYHSYKATGAFPRDGRGRIRVRRP